MKAFEKIFGDDAENCKVPAMDCPDHTSCFECYTLHKEGFRAALEWVLSMKMPIDTEGEYPREAINAYDIEQELSQ